MCDLTGVMWVQFLLLSEKDVLCYGRFDFIDFKNEHDTELNLQSPLTKSALLYWCYSDKEL